METIKSVLGLGTAPQEGREPVSGVSGSGVGGEPYDQGNVEDSTLGGKAPQHTDTITDGTNHGPYTIGTGLGSNSTATTDNTSSGITSSGGVTPNAASATSASGPAVDPTSSNTGVGTSNISATSTSTTSGPHSSDAANKVDPRVDSDKSKTDSTGPIGSSSWMSTALPHREGDNKTSNTGVPGTPTHQSSQSQAPVAGLEDITSQPPNVLPTNVPTGTSTDFGAPDSAITGTSSSAATSSIPSSSTNTTTDVSDKTVGVPSTTEPSHSLTGSRASIAPTKPTEKTGSSNVNPDAIPLAGGKKIGEDAYTERKSMQVDSIDADLPATTSSNTARNVGTAEATGRPSATLSEHEKSSVISDKEKSSVASGGSGSEHKEKKGLVEKIKEKVHIHKHDK